jgi:hypothetical protein
MQELRLYYWGTAGSEKRKSKKEHERLANNGYILATKSQNHLLLFGPALAEPIANC